jgi:hypothetical protein
LHTPIQDILSFPTKISQPNLMLKFFAFYDMFLDSFVWI